MQALAMFRSLLGQGRFRPVQATLVAWSLLFGVIPNVSVQAGQTDYRLTAGDVIEVSAANAPELRQRVPVQLDGTISLPLVGTIPAEGLPFSELRNRIQLALASRVLRVRTPDGRDSLARWTVTKFLWRSSNISQSSSWERLLDPASRCFGRA